MTDEIMDTAREIPWYNDLSEYQQMKLKTFVELYVKETCLELITRSSFDIDDIAQREFFNELEDEVVEHYYDMLQDEV